MLVSNTSTEGASTRCRASTTCGTRSSSTACRTGGSTRCRPKRSAARAASRCPRDRGLAATSRSRTFSCIASSACSDFPYAIEVAGPRTSASATSTATATPRSRSTRRLRRDPSHRDLRQREFASLTRLGRRARARPRNPRLGGPGPGREGASGSPRGFFNISGGAVHPVGDFYFVDARWQRIYRWTVAKTTALRRPRQPARSGEPRVRQGREPARHRRSPATAPCIRSGPSRPMLRLRC